ncbi:MAG TPA: DEAD/DEAH box helicase [Miltoncostaeaceae bacterium]|nr:DEAD/DEAH box helicase [Miltoncostaeaceae bacterium]
MAGVSPIAERTGDPALAAFHPAVRTWFATVFAEPTRAQRGGWPEIAADQHTLIIAPTGSGKTLAAFLWGLNRLIVDRLAGRETGRVLYVSPLKALNHDVERNLRLPLAGIAQAGERLGMSIPRLSVAVRTGDTPAAERRRMLRTPPDVLITTPESLYLLLTSRAREALATTRAVIVDEIHAVLADKRGTHLALSLERLEHLVGARDGRLQRIGLSATVRPARTAARFLGGHEPDGRPRPVRIVDAADRPRVDLTVEFAPVSRAEAAGRADAPSGPNTAPDGTRWATLDPRLLELIGAHRSTLVFVNNRRQAERLALRLNELAGRPVALAHHGSLAHARRAEIEALLKAGELPALVATSSLELGIDVGAIDLVVQIGSPRGVARGLQRVGRAGHRHDAVSRGWIFPLHRADLAECAPVVARMRAGEIERIHMPSRALDVLAQQLVALCAEGPWSVDDLHRLVRGAAPYVDLSRERLEAVLHLLTGGFSDGRFGDPRPRLVWDRDAQIVRAREGAWRVAVQNPGTIPDRGLYAVVRTDGARVGELDEEMVYEARRGQTFTLGASSWRIEEITRDRVIVTAAPGAPGELPFWHGDGLGRPRELGQDVGRWQRELLGLPPAAAERRLIDDCAFDRVAAVGLIGYLREQAAATGGVPDDRTVVIETFRDAVGDWRVCLLSPWGARVHAPWAMAIGARMRAAGGPQPHATWTDDGLCLHLPASGPAPDADLALMEPEVVGELVAGELADTALFAAAFRQNAARALQLTRHGVGRRTPLWQQRLRAQHLLEGARAHPDHPLVLETYRECLEDRLDLDGLRAVLTAISAGEVEVVRAHTPYASPFAGNLMFAHTARFFYEGDAPPGERRAQTLALSDGALRELLGREDLRDLIDRDALRRVEDGLQGRSSASAARTADDLHDLLRRVGDLSAEEIAARLAEPERAAEFVDRLVGEGRAVRLAAPGGERLVDVADAALYPLATGGSWAPAADDPSPRASADGTADDAAARLIARFARTHGPFTTEHVARRLGLDSGRAERLLEDMEAAGELARGGFTPDGREREWCEVEVLARLRRTSLAAARRAIAPVDGPALGRFLVRHQGIDRRPDGTDPADALLRALEPLVGIALTPAQWEREVLPRRCPAFTPALLDGLVARGEVVWVGAGGGGGGRVALYPAGDVALFGPPSADPPPDDPDARLVREALADGALFWERLTADLGRPRAELFAALWRLVWAGEVTNDLWSPLGAPRRLTPPATAGGPHRRRRVGPRASGAVAGRWSLTAPLFAPAPHEHERREAWAQVLLERHGVVARAVVAGEDVPGGFAGLYPSLTRMEWAGACRRGDFVAGLEGAQFALEDALSALRAPIDGGDARTPIVLGAADPAQPFGAALPWPSTRGGRTPTRVFGAQVVMVGGAPVLYLERGERGLVCFAEADPPSLRRALEGLVAWLSAREERPRALERVDGAPVHTSDLLPTLRAVGFREDLHGVILPG